MDPEMVPHKLNSDSTTLHLGPVLFNYVGASRSRRKHGVQQF
jgi:hypothetical protein